MNLGFKGVSLGLKELVTVFPKIVPLSDYIDVEVHIEAVLQDFECHVCISSKDLPGSLQLLLRIFYQTKLF